MVFVDDYVAGRTPNRCVYTGRPTSDRLTISTEIDGPSPAWFVLLLFPLLGWLILVVVLAASKRTYLSGTLPVSAAAFTATRRKRRSAKLAAFGGLITLIVAATSWLGAATDVLAVIAIAALVGGLVTLVVLDLRSPKVDLDGSRRWVTISRVHPEFASTVAAAADAALVDRSDG
jgi:hypothetical protein